MFVGLHAMAAMQTNTPELEIALEEGAAFMKAAQNVARHYSVETTQKTLDWIAFAGCTLGIYGPRVVAISVRKRAAAQERGQVIPFRRPQRASADAPAPADASPVMPMPDFEGNEDGFTA